MKKKAEVYAGSFPGIKFSGNPFPGLVLRGLCSAQLLCCFSDSFPLGGIVEGRDHQLTPLSLSAIPLQGVLTSTGAQTAKRAAVATPMGNVTQSVESAPATPTDGGGSASLLASVAREAAVTPALGPASVSLVGGLQIARSSARAICLAPAAIRLQVSASATEAGGAKGVPSTAPAMAHPVPRSLADASAGLGCGGLSASIPAIACTEPAAPRMDNALVRPATKARAAQTPALLGPTDLSADTGKRPGKITVCELKVSN